MKVEVKEFLYFFDWGMKLLLSKKATCVWMFVCGFTFDVSVCGHAVAEQLHVSLDWLHLHSLRPHTRIIPPSVSAAGRLCWRTKLSQSDVKTEEQPDVTRLASDKMPKTTPPPFLRSQAGVKGQSSGTPCSLLAFSGCSGDEWAPP